MHFIGQSLLAVCPITYSSMLSFCTQVNLINNLIERHASLKLDCYNILAAIHCLLGTLVSLTSDTAQKAIDDDFSLREGGTNQVLKTYCLCS